jgi:uncharacterized membrane protein YbhN (UPF0104 family)
MLTAKTRFGLRLGASAILLWLLASKVHWHALFGIWGRVHPFWLVCASVMAPMMIAGLAIRWRIFLRQQALELPRGTVLGLTWAGQFFNSVLPGSTGGDVVKIYQVCRLLPERKAAAVASVIVDRFTALIALAALAGASFLYGGALPEVALKSLPGPKWAWLAGAAGIVVIATAVLAKLASAPHWVARLRQVVAALRSSFTLNRAFFLGLSIAFVVHGLNVSIFYGFARALGIPLSYVQAFSFYPIVLFLLLIPVTVNGHGLREMLLLFYFTRLHIALPSMAGVGPMETVFSLSILCVANDLLWTIPGGLWYLLTVGKRPRA